MRAFIFTTIFALPWVAVAASGVHRGVEPGLAEAVEWKWSPEPAKVAPITAPARGRDGLTAPGAPAASPMRPSAAAGERTYTVERGDALVKIARKFGITVQQLQYANNLQGTLIHVGDVLRIPDAAEIAKMPQPEPSRRKPSGTPQPATGLPPGTDPVALRLQIFLDRRDFSHGPIDGKPDVQFQKLVISYLAGGGEFSDPGALQEAATAELPDPITTYTLRPVDMLFIESAGRASLGEMMAAPALPYRSAWEFVAERFHCEESFLRTLNRGLPANPAPGTVFRVPAVEPFEIENAVRPGLQPPSGSAPPGLEAAIVDLTVLQILKDGKLVASFPLGIARPGLRGRGTWTILEGYPWPRLKTLREPRIAPQTFTRFDAQGREIVEGPAAKAPAPPGFLPAGPRNPVGVFWIDLAKEGDPEPLPFGLHGTAVPDRMAELEGLGGFRMTNWDIVRAARLLPAGTPLHWRSESPAMTAAPRPAPR